MSIQQHLKLLGTIQRDLVTGVSEVITSISFDLYGCILAIMQQPKNDKGEVPESHWYDVKRLVPCADGEVYQVMDAPNFETMAVGAEAGPAEKPKLSTQPIP